MVLLKKIRNIILITVGVIILVISMSLAGAYFYRNEIIEIFVEKVNQHINTPVETERIQLDLWSNFPYLSLQLDKVKIHESAPLVHDYLCTADRIGFSFNILYLPFRKYTVRSIEFRNAVFNLAVQNDGTRNFNIIESRNFSGEQSRNLPELAIQRIRFVNSNINYSDLGQNVHVSVYADPLDNNLRLKNEDILISVSGKAKLDTLLINGTSYLQNREFDLETELAYNLSVKRIDFNKSDFFLNNHHYLMNGSIETTGKKYIDLRINSAKNNIQTLVSLLPAKYRKPLGKYKSKGHIDFEGSITGSVKGDNRPEINFLFSCRNVEFYYPGYKKSFHNLSFSGNFSNGENRNINSSSLELNNFRGYIDNQEISGNLRIRDLKDLHTYLDLEGNFDFRSLLETFPVKTIESGDGNVHFNLQLQGSLRGLRENNSGDVRAAGGIDLHDVFFITSYTPLPFKDLNGRLVFNNLDLGIQNLNGWVGESQFNLSGFFKNIIPYILFKDRPIRIEADLKSEYLNLNELFTLDFTNRKDEREADDSRYHLGISPRLNIDFNCEVASADLKRFHGKKIRGKLRIKDQIAIVEDASMNTMGGKLYLSGSIQSKHPQYREFLVDGQLENIYIDSVFYVFNNFNQKFLVDHNLKGQINAFVNNYFVMDEDLKFYPGSLNTHVETRIKRGQLIDFRPIQTLSKYLKNEDLSNVRFSDLQNTIQIKDRQVIIPEMEIISGAYNITVYGTHTFEQDIEYHFMIPLDQFRGSDPDERFGTIRETDSGPPNLFLKMQGKASDYKVTYDTRAVTEKIKEDLKEEGRELKEIFRKKEEKEEEQVGLEEEDYFDFQ